MEEAASSDHEAGDEPGKHVLLTKQQYMDFTCATEESYKYLVLKYKKSQAALKKKPTHKKPLASTSYFSVSVIQIVYLLMFLHSVARYRHHLIGFRKTTPNIQIVGFSNDNSYQDVLS